MEFWRHDWTTQDWWTFPYILTNFKNFGFIDAITGEEIDDSLEPSQRPAITDYSTDCLIKWKYDSYAQGESTPYTNCIDISWNVNGKHYNWGDYSGANALAFRTYNTRYTLSHHQGGINLTEGNLKTFFIPIKNNGFLLNTRCYADGIKSGGVHVPLDLDKTQNPTLWTSGTEFENSLKKYYDTTDIGDTNNFICNNLLAIPVSNNLLYADYLYILFSNYSNNPSTKNRDIILSGNNINTKLQFHESIPDFEQFKEAVHNYPGTREQQAIRDSVYFSHINVTSNVCNLVKYPYENTFLDNLYIMTTMPTNFSDNIGFFSMNNRNFMKVLENIVVELPIN